MKFQVDDKVVYKTSPRSSMDLTAAGYTRRGSLIVENQKSNDHKIFPGLLFEIVDNEDKFELKSADILSVA